MNDRLSNMTYGGMAPGSALSQVERNKVLRNTYLLLAMTLLPTIAGAWIGVNTGIARLFVGGMGLLLFFGGAFGLMFAVQRTRNSGAGVALLMAFTFFMGLALSPLIAFTLGLRNGPQLIMTAMGGTAGVFFLMSVLSTVIKRDLSGMGKWLMVGALVVIVGAIINVFVGSTAGMMAISTLVVGVFSLFMLYDLKRIIDGGETNYIMATLALYLDLFNVFQGLLILLGMGSSD
ncbi:MAG: Bax inhibitor-1/YccA family protein [Ottowia sp.]|nr:Bax inhibitor-1/YccA family protein [Ottowia sp.]